MAFPTRNNENPTDAVSWVAPSIQNMNLQQQSAEFQVQQAQSRIAALQARIIKMEGLDNPVKALANKKRLAEINAMTEEQLQNYLHTASKTPQVSTDRRTAEQRQASAKALKQAEEADNVRKVYENARPFVEKVAPYIPVLGPWMLAGQAQYERGRGNFELADALQNQAILQGGLDLFTMGTGGLTGAAKGAATSAIGGIAGRYVGDKFGYGDLGEFVGGMGAGVAPQIMRGTQAGLNWLSKQTSNPVVRTAAKTMNLFPTTHGTMTYNFNQDENSNSSLAPTLAMASVGLAAPTSFVRRATNALYDPNARNFNDPRVYTHIISRTPEELEFTRGLLKHNNIPSPEGSIDLTKQYAVRAIPGQEAEGYGRIINGFSDTSKSRIVHIGTTNPTFGDFGYRLARVLPEVSPNTESGKYFSALGVRGSRAAMENIGDSRALLADIRNQLFEDGSLHLDDLINPNFKENPILYADDLPDWINSAHSGIYAELPNTKIEGFRKERVINPRTGVSRLQFKWANGVDREAITNNWRYALPWYKNGNKIQG